MNRRTWIASVGAAFVFTGLRNRDVCVREQAQSVDFSNDAVWSELCTAAFATAARATAFVPDPVDDGD